MADKKPLKIEDLGGGAGSIKEFETGDTLPGSVLPNSDGITEGTTNLYFGAARVRAVVLTGLSVATNAVIAATDSILVAAGKLQAQITSRAMAGVNNDITQINGLSVPLSRQQGGNGGEQGFIEGLSLTWNSGASITIGAGSAYVPSVDKVVVYAGGTIVPSGVVDVNTFVHLYLSSTGTIVQSLTAPVRYYNQAFQLTGDNSRRYIGSLHVTTNAAGVTRFVHRPTLGMILYTLANPQAAPFRILAGATGINSVTTRSVTPPTSHTMEGTYQNTGTVAARVTPSDAGTSVTTGWMAFINPGQIWNAKMPMAADGTITYDASSGASLSVYLHGYYFDR